MFPEITRFRSVGLRSVEQGRHHAFYAGPWGLETAAATPGTIYLRGAGQEPYILSLHAAGRTGLDHLRFGMRHPADVRHAAELLAAAGMRIVMEPGPLTSPGGGYGLRFTDPENRLIELAADVAPPEAPFPDKYFQPLSLCHVVLNTVNIDAACAFYTDVLGFRVSDWSEHQMVFLRCNSKHHVISFNQAPHTSVNHVAYLMSGVDELMRGLSTLRKSGNSPAWGPGRHGPGNNVFCYFNDGCGYVAEFTCDIDVILDEARHVPRIWQRLPELMDRWGTAGPPSADVRSAMAGEPDPGWIPAPAGGINGTPHTTH